MADPEDIVDIDGLRTGPAAPGRGGQLRGHDRGRPWLAVHWRCCGAYSRVYRNASATAYEGRCPKCGRAVRVTIGPGGTNNRFFEAY
jgi:hypothetical protein